MRDFQFVLPRTTLRESTRYRAARACSLYPLFPDRATNATELLSLIERSVCFRRERFDELLAAGWDAIQNPVAFQFARNCPPVGLNVPGDYKNAQPCQRLLGCPPCWSRHYVLDPFIWQEGLMYGSTDPNGPDGRPKVPPPGVFVVSFITRYKIRLTPNEPGLTALDLIHLALGIQKPDLGVEGLWRRYIRSTSHRRMEFEIHKSLAGFMTHRIDFTDGPALLLDRCGVLLTMTPATTEYHRGVIAASLEKKAEKRDLVRIADVRNHGPATKATLAKAYMHALYYPAGIARHPDLDQVVAVFHALAEKPGLRMSAQYGPKTQEDFFAAIGLNLGEHLERHHGHKQVER